MFIIYRKTTYKIINNKAISNKMDKNQWILAKIRELISEGRQQEQAVSIAMSMWDSKSNMQEGGVNNQEYFRNIQEYLTPFTPALQNMPMAQVGGKYTQFNNPFSQGVPNMTFKADVQTDLNPAEQLTEAQKFAQSHQNPDGFYGNFSTQAPTAPKVQNFQDYNAQEYNREQEKNNAGDESNDWIKYSILNPYGQGMDLNTSLAYTGQQFSKGNTGAGVMGAGLSVLKGARSFLSGYGSGKGEKNLEDQYKDKMYNNDESLYGYQVGGTTEDRFTPPTIPDNQAELDQVDVEAASRARQLLQEQQQTPIEDKNFDKNSARDTWVKKTGMPWSEARRLGYTDGTAKDNTKLLGELNDSRFKKENLRTKPFTSPTQQRQQVTQQQTTAPAQTFEQAMKGKPKYQGNSGNISQVEDKNAIDRLGQVVEYLGNPLQSFGEYAKYGELPAKGFSKHKTNALDDVINMINPASWASHGANAVDYTEQGEYGKASMEALQALPVLQKLKYIKTLPLPQQSSVAKQLGIGAGKQSKQLGQGALNYLFDSPQLGTGAKQIGQGAQKLLRTGQTMADGSYRAGSYLPTGIYQQGGYTTGQEYDLDEKEIENLVKQGYKIRYV